MAYVPVAVLRVKAWNRTVGAVAAGRRGGTVFEYDPGWLASGVELSPGSLPTSAGARSHAFGPLPEVFRGLAPMLADSLPDSFGNALVDAHLSGLGMRPADVSALDRLAYVGSRGMGALEFEPAIQTDEPPTPLVLADLVAAARAAARAAAGAAAGGMTPPGAPPPAVSHLFSVGTSAGGAQAKAVVAWDPQTGELRADAPGLPGAFEPWMLKFDGVSGQSGRVEYAYSLMARAAGIDMAATRLLEESGRAHFMTRRFDRREGRRLHLQSFAALAGLDFTLLGVHSYAQLFAQLEPLGLGPPERQELFRRAAFNTLAANNDDHPKNTSFLCDQDGTWELAPAYDLTFAADPAVPWLARHHLAVEGRHEGVSRQHLRVMGDRFDVPGVDETLGQVEDAVGRWPEHAREAGVPRDAAAAVAAALGELRAGAHGR
ncbi:MAG: type II toxin-antitoxin system HipA family toxin [Bifidobacteriaceae bacterium]|jgi:serine/threonine-protein kinase HipA|nr:type II toxin-antitoxin system HipA family toxin [Bifidobacteriaceae bacterium]